MIGGDEVGREHALLDHVHVAIDDEPAVERGDRRLEVERVDQHRHAARRTAARDREQDAGVAAATAPRRRHDR